MSAFDPSLDRGLRNVERIRREIAQRYFAIGALFTAAVFGLVALWVRAGGQ